MSAEDEFTAVYRDQFEELCKVLHRKFERLDDAACADLVQLATMETLGKIRRENFQPEKDWRSWLLWLSANRARDYLRQVVEVASLDALAANDDGSCLGWQLADAGSPPSQVLAEAERRGRQGLTLSQILAEFSRWCESRSDGHKMKEFYERSLRGQKAADIAASKNVPRGTVKVTLNRARDWVLDRIRQADVHRSVFATLHRRKPEEGAAPSLVGEVFQLDPKLGSTSGQPDGPSRSHNPPAIRNFPTLTTFEDVVRWAIDELGAMCPSPARLQECIQTTDAVQFSDIRFHVDDVGCRLCEAELAGK